MAETRSPEAVATEWITGDCPLSLADLLRREREAAFDAGANLAGAVQECVTVWEAAEVSARIRRACIEGGSDGE